MCNKCSVITRLDHSTSRERRLHCAHAQARTRPSSHTSCKRNARTPCQVLGSDSIGIDPRKVKQLERQRNEDCAEGAGAGASPHPSISPTVLVFVRRYSQSGSGTQVRGMGPRSPRLRLHAAGPLSNRPSRSQCLSDACTSEGATWG